MSGGHWDYRNDNLARDIFGWHLNLDYGEQGFAERRKAMRLNPLEDKEISGLVWDVFCLLHSYDWYASGDTSEETYRQDVEFFKNRWLKPSRKNVLRGVVEDCCEDLKEELFRMIGEGTDKDETGVHQ